MKKETYVTFHNITVVSDREDQVIQIEGENWNRAEGSKGRRRSEGQEGKTRQ